METDIHFLDVKSINTIFYNENDEYIFNSNPVSQYLSSIRRSIYELLDKAIKNDSIEPINCGGLGEMIKVTEDCIEKNRYKDIFQYKLIAIFDSDRGRSYELPKKANKITIEFFKRRAIVNTNDCDHEPTDLILWHMLYKKKIENYVPLSVILSSIKLITQKQKEDLEAKTPEELDFLEYNSINVGIGERQIKTQFPDMFLSNFSYRDFEKRCEHHKGFLPEANESISEIEQILLKIAKIL
jgi:hypothetical protein